MSLISAFTRTLLITLTLSASAFAYSEEEGQDMFQRGLYEEAILHWKKAVKAGDFDGKVGDERGPDRVPNSPTRRHDHDQGDGLA